MPVLTTRSVFHRQRSPWPARARMLLTLGCLSAWMTNLASAQYSPQPKPPAASETASPDLAGEWRAQLQFSSGAFASIKDLEFMYAFNQGGTMTESIRMSANSRCSQRSIRVRIVNRLYAATAFVKNYGSSVKAYRESPAPTTRYC